MKASEYQKELQELEELYAKIERMTEKEAQDEMNTNEPKMQILMYIQEDMDDIQEKLDELECEEEESSCGYEVDPAFSSWREFYSMVV